MGGRMKKKAGFCPMILICSSVILLVLLIVFVLLTISGIFCKPEYLKPWDKEYYSNYKDPRISLISLGILAANGHNMQPWKIRLDKEDDSIFYLYADKDRMTKEVDPYARQMMISQGTFLEYVSIAGEALGYETDIELFPEGEYNEENLENSMEIKPVAKVEILKEDTGNTIKKEENSRVIHRENKGSRELYQYLFMPDTNRGAYQKVSLTDKEKVLLEEINSDATLFLQIYNDKENTEKLGKFALQGAYVESEVPKVMKESEVIFRSNEYEKNKYSYGFSVEGQGTNGFMKHVMQGLVTIFPSMNQGKAAKEQYRKAAKQSVSHTMSYVLIQSKDNSRTSQVKSGMLYSRLILKAHSMGLVMQPFSQPLEEYPQMKTVYDGIHKEYGKDSATLQMLVRIGKPTQNTPRTMRQDVMKFMIAD